MKFTFGLTYRLRVSLINGDHFSKTFTDIGLMLAAQRDFNHSSNVARVSRVA